MVYRMHLYVDGGCRRNGYSDAIAAAACVLQQKWGRQKSFAERLPDYPSPTSQRAELVAIILALQTAWNRYTDLDGNPYIDVTIHTDSKYALGCMTEWKTKWTNNGFINSTGYEVVNRDLIEEAYDLDEKVANEGCVNIIWIPRNDNEDADRLVNEELDEME